MIEKRDSIHWMAGADTKARPYKNSLSLALSQGNKGILGWFSAINSRRNRLVIGK